MGDPVCTVVMEFGVQSRRVIPVTSPMVARSLLPSVSILGPGRKERGEELEAHWGQGRWTPKATLSSADRSQGSL